MRLTKNLKAKILQQFKAGASVSECASWYNQQCIRVEGVIRAALISADKPDRPLISSNYNNDQQEWGNNHE